MEYRASRPRVAIIGAGISGLCMGASLMREGMVDFVIFEKAKALGGTWRDNVYPGSGCDVPSHLYCYSFDPNPEFSRAFAEQPEILEYLQRFARTHGLSPHIRFETAVEHARFDERRSTWVLRTSTRETLEFDAVVTATGQLNRPHRPRLPGLADFGGTVFHSAEWRTNHDLRGERVAIVGTGASAVQLVPSIAPVVSRLYVFQRTPSWVIPKLDHAYPESARRVFRAFPALLRLNRYLLYWLLEPRFAAFTIGSRLGALFEKNARKYLEAQVSDPVLREQLTPNYPPGCKRVLISNDYLAALQRPEVELVTSPIVSVVREGIVTGDGRLRSVDTIVLATGFEATSFLVPMSVEGLGGVRLEDQWQHGAEAYLGMTVSGFPNLFMLYGPNTNLGHNSIIFMVECQVRYVTELVRELRDRKINHIQVRRDVMNRFNEEVQEKLARSVWNAGCTNWYTNAAGKQTNNWPFFTVQYWQRTRNPRAEDFERSVEPDGHERSTRRSALVEE